MIYPGSEIRLRARFTDTAQALDVDPDDVVLKVCAPDGTLSTIELADLVRDDTGRYYYDLTVDKPGVWRYRFEATGAHMGAGEGFVRVVASLLQ